MLNLKQPQQFKQAVQSAIEKYESGFDDRNPMHTHRATNIIDLEAILNADDQTPIAIKNSMRAYLNNPTCFRTGWWIFYTGRSQLKTNLVKVFNDYPDTVFLDEAYAAITELQPLAERAKREAKQQCPATSPQNIEIQQDAKFQAKPEYVPAEKGEAIELEELHKKLEKTEIELNEERAQSKQLIEEKRALEKRNHTLAAKIQETKKEKLPPPSSPANVPVENAVDDNSPTDANINAQRAFLARLSFHPHKD